MKSLLFTILAIVFGLMFFFYRRRLRLAVLVAGGLYLAVTIVRFVVMREEIDRFAQLGLAIGGMAGVWLLANLLTGVVQHYRGRRVRG